MANGRRHVGRGVAGVAVATADGVAAPAVAAGLAAAFAGVDGAALAAPPPCDESFRLVSRSLASLSPRTSPTAIVMISGTAISMIRLLGAPDGDQCLLRINPPPDRH
jgi:hypothetical protein